MPVRLTLLPRNLVPVAVSLIEDAAEWHMTSQVFTFPEDVLGQPGAQWQAAYIKEELIGVVGFTGISWPDGRAEMFTSIVPKWRKKGLSEPLVRAQLEYAFNDLGLRKITMTCLAGSPAAKIADKLKVRCEGVFKKHRLRGGVYLDALAYGLEKGEAYG